MYSNTHPDSELIAKLTANMLLEIDAVHFRTDQPYKLTSGLASPVYIDCRKLISFPRIRSALMDFCISTIQRNAGFEKFDSIAGGETAGIPFAAWISDRLGLPMNYIRKKPKGFGRDAQIEGASIEGKNVLLVEDLTTDGGSKIKFCDAMRKAGAEVTDTLVIFYYDIFEGANDAMKKHGLSLHYLATWRDVLEAAKEKRKFDTNTLSGVENFLSSPLEWSAANGGVDKISI